MPAEQAVVRGLATRTTRTRVAVVSALAFITALLVWGNGPKASAITLQATIPNGKSASVVAVNPATNRIYSLDFSAGVGSPPTVYVIDGSSNTVFTQIPLVGPSLVDIGVDVPRNKIYVTANSGGPGAGIWQIDGVTNAATFLPLADSAPNALAVNQVTHKVYVAHYNGATAGKIAVVDGDNFGPGGVSVVDLGSVTAYPRNIAINQKTNKVYVALEGQQRIAIIDGATNGLGFLNTGGAINFDIDVNPVTNRVYTTQYYAASVFQIDANAFAITNTIPVGTNPTEIKVNSATNKIYVTNSSSGTVSAIDGTTNVASTIGVGTAPNGLAVNMTTNMVYVVNITSTNMSVINGATGVVTSTQLLGNIPASGLAVNPSNSRIYVPVNGTKQVMVFEDTNSDGLAEQIESAESGQNTRMVCAEGSIRAGFQMYVTIASEQSQTVRIDYLTNFGTFTKFQSIVGGQRYTEDVNGNLSALMAAVHPDTSDVDTAVKVSSVNRVYVACPFYFSRSIGAAGAVNGGHVQDSTHN